MGQQHKDLVGAELHIGKTNVSAGTPVGSQNAGVIGEFYWDSTANKLYVAEATGTGNWIHSGGAFDEFIELTDTPSTYSGQGGLVLQVNSGATAVEFGQNLNTTVSPTFTGLVNPTSLTLLTPNIIHKPASAVDSFITLQNSLGVEKLRIKHREVGLTEIVSSVGLSIHALSAGDDGNMDIFAGQDLRLEGDTLIQIGSNSNTGDIAIDTSSGSIFIDVITGSITLRTGGDLRFNATGTNLIPIFSATSSGANGSIYREFASIVTPIGNITGNPGDRCTFVSGALSRLFIHEGATSNNTDWKGLISETSGVTKVGTPVDNQIAIWTGPNTIEGVTALTFDGTSLGVLGSVGIGTLSPADTLQVTGSQGGGGTIRASFTNVNGAGFFNMFVFNDLSKSVGFQLAGSVVGGTFDGVSVNNLAKLVSDADNLIIGTSSTGSVALMVGNNRKLVVLNDGNVGIGIVLPTARLHVSGDAIITGDLTVDTNTLFVDSASNEVGIRTLTPDHVLHIEAGDADALRVRHSGARVGMTFENTTNDTILRIRSSAGISWDLQANTADSFVIERQDVAAIGCDWLW